MRAQKPTLGFTLTLQHLGGSAPPTMPCSGWGVRVTEDPQRPTGALLVSASIPRMSTHGLQGRLPGDGARGVLERFLLSAHVSSWLMFSCKLYGKMARVPGGLLPLCVSPTPRPYNVFTREHFLRAFEMRPTDPASGALGRKRILPYRRQPDTQLLTARAGKTPTFQQRRGGERLSSGDSVFVGLFAHDIHR